MKSSRPGPLVDVKKVEELAALIGDRRDAQRILFVWVELVRCFFGASDDFFTGPAPETDAERVKKLRSAAKHIAALVPLLDQRMAWLVAVQTPGFRDGPKVSNRTERRLARLVHSLASLQADIERAAVANKPRKGRPLRPAPTVLHLVQLIANLKDVGVPFSAAENSKMVRAVRLCWEAAGLDGDPRDLIRSLKTKKMQGA